VHVFIFSSFEKNGRGCTCLRTVGLYMSLRSGTLFIIVRLNIYLREWDSIYMSGTVYISEGAGLYSYGWDSVCIRGSGTLFILLGLYI